MAWSPHIKAGNGAVAIRPDIDYLLHCFMTGAWRVLLIRHVQPQRVTDGQVRVAFIQAVPTQVGGFEGGPKSRNGGDEPDTVMSAAARSRVALSRLP